MLKRGLNPDQVQVETANYRYSSGYEAAKRILNQEMIPTAILCFNDEMAFAAKAAASELGLQVPEDVSLIGFDNWNMSAYGNMKLTTVERNMGELAKEGTRVLLRQLEDGIIDHRRIYLDNKLIVRETVKDMREISR